MTRPVTDKAEVALEYPDKVYVGTFERSSRFNAHFDKTGMALTLERPGDETTRKSIHLHLNYGLFADVLAELASALGREPIDPAEREQIRDAVAHLAAALDEPAA